MKVLIETIPFFLSKKEKPHCRSLLHKYWFRVVAVLMSLFLFLLSLLYIAGLDILAFLPHSFLPRLVVGSLYALFSLLIVHYVLEYEREKDLHCYVCQHCVSVLLNDKEE